MIVNHSVQAREVRVGDLVAPNGADDAPLIAQVQTHRLERGDAIYTAVFQLDLEVEDRPRVLEFIVPAHFPVMVGRPANDGSPAQQVTELCDRLGLEWRYLDGGGLAITPWSAR
ncbi:hypothetical protein SEA_CRACKLEWINK_117 [Mycobacterium phage Cracklewink]|uniref:Uncharacterized protein n=1 Tax=Mycobacterium phage Bipper TaxID=1805457 RepID=A0A142F2P5_9CAUD|nr:hypothetical protein KCH39_gp060 [Mycobacterium phage Bipper]AMQ67052.1 hypothetical protein SEA_BIPPER_117 [Mycobacterium phage Bipper]QDF19403.1 hypothetical protein SEA_CRACKLEWINK_117 [Mycobacterium phage Cracklewink]